MAFPSKHNVVISDLCYSCIGPDCEDIVADYPTSFSPSRFSKAELDEIVKKVRENLDLDHDDGEDKYDVNPDFASSSGYLVFDVELREEYNRISDLLTVGDSAASNSNSSSSSSSSNQIVPVLYCKHGCVVRSPLCVSN